MLFPSLFLSHGSPMLALETPSRDPYVKALRELWERLPKPKAVVFVSAHWYVNGNFVDVSAKPKTIYDFFGFPTPLYKVEYPAPGFPEALPDIEAAFWKGYWKSVERGFDHGVWTTLVHLFPKADVPVITLSLNAALPPEGHFETGRKLRDLRSKGYLVIGGGNLVHDLWSVDFSKWPGTAPHPFAKEFDDAFAEALKKNDVAPLFSPLKMPGGIRSVPTPDHYLPALVALWTAMEGETATTVFEGFELASIGRRSFGFGL